MKKYVKRIFSIILTFSVASGLAACKTEHHHSAKDDSYITASSEPADKESSGALDSASSEIGTIPAVTEPSKDENTVPSEWRDGGIFSDYYEKACFRMEQMTTDEKVGQLILARCPADDAYELAKEFHLGGYVLFYRDFEDKTKDDVIKEMVSYTKAQDIPMIISVDEEGGTVSRLSGHSDLTEEDFLSPREIFGQGGIEAIQKDALRKAQLLVNLGINTNLAPVCDICTGEDKFMYDRSLGQSTDVTCRFVREVTKISQENGISVTLKHFPGYGNNEDTHTGIAVDKRNIETFESTDFKPFKAGIDEGAHVVLVSHNIVECMDAEKPASLSENVHEILRKELGFTGIVITDDLGMGAISEYSPDQSVVVNAFLAGNDMLCVSDIDSTYDKLLEAVHSGVIEKDALNHSVMRILAWKYAKGLLKD